MTHTEYQSYSSERDKIEKVLSLIQSQKENVYSYSNSILKTPGIPQLRRLFDDGAILFEMMGRYLDDLEEKSLSVDNKKNYPSGLWEKRSGKAALKSFHNMFSLHCNLYNELIGLLGNV